MKHSLLTVYLNMGSQVVFSSALTRCVQEWQRLYFTFKLHNVKTSEILIH